MTEVIELVPGELYRLGARIPAVHDGRTSFLPPYAQGEFPINSYLLVTPEEALLVDGGFALHGAQLADQIDALLPPGRPLSIFLTRFEADTLTGIGPTLARRELKAIYGGSNTNPYDYFDNLSSDGITAAEFDMSLYRKPPGTPIELGGGRQIVVVATTLRLLSTFWLHDAATGTLFTSDAFAHNALPHPGGPARITDPDDLADAEQTRAQLLTKYDYLVDADVAAVRAGVEQIFERHRVERIAPSYGCLVDGPALARQSEIMHDVLTSLERTSTVNVG